VSDQIVGSPLLQACGLPRSLLIAQASRGGEMRSEALQPYLAYLRAKFGEIYRL
jgi:hypothetical protein